MSEASPSAFEAASRGGAPLWQIQMRRALAAASQELLRGSVSGAPSQQRRGRLALRYVAADRLCGECGCASRGGLCFRPGAGWASKMAFPLGRRLGCYGYGWTGGQTVTFSCAHLVRFSGVASLTILCEHEAISRRSCPPLHRHSKVEGEHGEETRVIGVRMPRQVCVLLEERD